MTKRFYNIAGIDYCVAVDKDVPLYSEGVLANYTSSPCENPHTITMKITDEMPVAVGEMIYTDNSKRVFITEESEQIRYEGVMSDDLSDAYMRIDRKHKSTFVNVRPRSFCSKTILRAMELEHFIADNRGVLFHCAYIGINGKALIFTAPSGVGKSTQASLWCENRNAELVNGDRCALMVRDTTTFACGVPYCGSSGVNHNRSLPVEAIVYLEQAPFTSAEKLSGIRAFKKIWEGICVNTWNPSDMSACVETVTCIAENVPVFLLRCTPDTSAVKELERVLKEL